MNPKETLLYTPIDFVGSDSRAKDFGRVFSRDLVRAQRIISDNDYKIHLALKTTVIAKSQHGWGISEEGEEDFDMGIERLRAEGIDYDVEIWPSGPTRSMYKVLFDQGAVAAGFPAIGTSDLDVFPPHKNLENMLALYRHSQETGSLLGVGSRDKRVVLAHNPENDYLRRIYEGIINIAIAEGPGKIEISNPGKAPVDDPAYKAHGDFVTGAYLVNHDHEKAASFSQAMVKMARENGFSGFEDEYAMTLVAAGMGNMSAVYFNTAENLQDPLSLEEERTKIIKRQIIAPLEKLSLTSVAPMIQRGIEVGRRKLTAHYSEEQVEEVANIMSEVLKAA